MKKIAVFASGSGTNFQAIIDAIKEGALEAQIEILICDLKAPSVFNEQRRQEFQPLLFLQKTMRIKQDMNKIFCLNLKNMMLNLLS